MKKLEVRARNIELSCQKMSLSPKWLQVVTTPKKMLKYDNSLSPFVAKSGYEIGSNFGDDSNRESGDKKENVLEK